MSTPSQIKVVYLYLEKFMKKIIYETTEKYNI